MVEAVRRRTQGGHDRCGSNRDVRMTLLRLDKLAMVEGQNPVRQLLFVQAWA